MNMLSGCLLSFSLYLSCLLTACGGQASSVPDSQTKPATAGVFGEAKKSDSGVFWVRLAWSTGLEAGTLANSAEVKFLDEGGQPLAAVLNSFKLFMPSMGHGSIKTKEMTLTQDPTEPSLWDVGNIYFSMGGGVEEWVVDITATVEGQVDKLRVAIPFEVQ